MDLNKEIDFLKELSEVYVNNGKSLNSFLKQLKLMNKDGEISNEAYKLYNTIGELLISELDCSQLSPIINQLSDLEIEKQPIYKSNNSSYDPCTQSNIFRSISPC